MRPMIKLFSQFEQVANATPFALRDEGKISLGTAQGTLKGVEDCYQYDSGIGEVRTGPHEAPKLSM